MGIHWGGKQGGNPGPSSCQISGKQGETSAFPGQVKACGSARWVRAYSHFKGRTAGEHSAGKHFLLLGQHGYAP